MIEEERARVPEAMSHRRVELRSLAMHQEIARKLLEDSSPVVEKARANLDRWAATAGRSAPYLEEWRRLLHLPAAELAKLIVEDSERMTELRQSSPFAGVLTPRERWRILDASTVGACDPGVGNDRR